VVPDRAAVVRHITETRRRLRRQFAAHESHPLLDVHVTMAQLKILIMLSRSGGMSGQELARNTKVALATMTGIIDRLVAQHLVSRREDPHDRRVRRLELTSAGSELVERVIAAGEEQHERLLERLDLPSLQLVAQAFDLIMDAASRPASAEVPSPSVLHGVSPGVKSTRTDADSSGQ
jgi:DNA-binding MarR family transcriptional regulator